MQNRSPRQPRNNGERWNRDSDSTGGEGRGAESGRRSSGSGDRGRNSGWDANRSGRGPGRDSWRRDGSAPSRGTGGESRGSDRDSRGQDRGRGWSNDNPRTRRDSDSSDRRSRSDWSNRDSNQGRSDRRQGWSERGSADSRGDRPQEGSYRGSGRGAGSSRFDNRKRPNSSDRPRDDRPRRDANSPRDDRRTERGSSGPSGWSERRGSNRDDRPRQTRDSRSQHSDNNRDRRPRSSDRRSFTDGFDAREEKVVRPGHEARADEPPTPQDFDESLLPLAIKAELKSLPKDLADTVGAHLVVAGELIEEDPELAYRHAEAARRRAARLPIVREAAAEAAYAAGEFAAALREFRALRRMSGSVEYAAVIADCERALGKPREAIETIQSVNTTMMSPTQRIELLIVEAGARSDLGQLEEAVRLLENGIRLGKGPKLAQGRLRFAYAELLVEAGQLESAREWLAAVVKFDPEDELGALERLSELETEDQVLDD